jgi:hypothetical protein
LSDFPTVDGNVDGRPIAPLTQQSRCLTQHLQLAGWPISAIAPRPNAQRDPGEVRSSSYTERQSPSPEIGASAPVKSTLARSYAQFLSWD